jgi:hypothetical protein
MLGGPLPFQAELLVLSFIYPVGIETASFVFAQMVFFLYSVKGDFYPDKKQNKIFLIYQEIQMGSGAKSYMRKGFLIYEEMHKFFPIYEEAVSHIWLCTRSLFISLYMRKIFFSFLSV